MANHFEANTLVELEFELNRRDILHCRSLILSTPASDEFILLAPPPVEHAYTFKQGNRIDLYISLLKAGDAQHTLHVKTRVLHVGKEGALNTLHLKKTGFSRKILHLHFFTLITKTAILLEPLVPSEKNGSVLAKVHSISLKKMNISTALPLDPGSLWRCSVEINSALFDFQGMIGTETGTTPLVTDHSAAFHFDEMDHQILLNLAETIETVQINYIRARSSLSLHEVFDRSDIQDSLLLEHLVPRSIYRVALDYLELSGWLLLVYTGFEILLAAPPGATVFDRFFGVTLATAWDRKHLVNVPFYMIMESAIFLIAFLLHQLIYYRGNTRSRWSLWLMALLASLLFLMVRSHL